MNIIDDLEMSGNPHSTTDRAMSADLRATGNTDTAGNRGMCADAYVMRDLNLIVELDPVPDHGIVECPAIYGCIGTYLNIITDAHLAQLRYLNPCILIAGQTKAIAADNCTRVNQYAASNLRGMTKRNVRHETTIRTNTDIFTNEATCSDTHVSRDFGPRLDNTVWAD